jgi:hypothetical protein
MTLNKQLCLASWGILTIGLVTAAFIYLFAPPEAVDPFGDPLLSRHYINELEIWGGKLNIIQAEFVSWFNGLWSGKQLAITIACLSGFLFLVLRFIANPFRLNATILPDNYGTEHVTGASDPLTVPDSQPCQGHGLSPDKKPPPG